MYCFGAHYFRNAALSNISVLFLFTFQGRSFCTSLNLVICYGLIHLHLKVICCFDGEIVQLYVRFIYITHQECNMCRNDLSCLPVCAFCVPQ